MLRVSACASSIMSILLQRVLECGKSKLQTTRNLFSFACSATINCLEVNFCLDLVSFSVHLLLLRVPCKLASRGIFSSAQFI